MLPSAFSVSSLAFSSAFRPPSHSSRLAGEVTIATLSDAVEHFLRDENLEAADIVGSSMGVRQDRVTPLSEAAVAMSLYPDATLHVFENCGHFPHRAQPQEIARFILDSTTG